MAALFTAAALAVPSPLGAQAPEGTSLFLAIPETFPQVDARAALIREPGREIIVLRESDATAETLGTALQLLRRLRADPLRPGQGQMVAVTGYVVTNPLGGAERERLDAALARLRVQPLAQVGNLGPGRSIPFAEQAR
jgi:hypothetical protein